MNHVADSSGPSEHHVPLLLAELETVTPNGDIERLRMLAGVQPLPADSPARTIRHWQQSRQEKYGEFFQGWIIG